ncbi:MAG: zinc ribbon domain-containing protein, partial [Candidatus Coproplasma sp.]
QEEMAKHAKIKKILKIIGFVLLGCGVVLDIIFFVDMFSAIGSFNAPSLFFCGIIGLPLTGFGGMLLSIGFRGEITRYMKNEGVPVVNDAAQDLKPAVKAVAKAVKEVKEGEKGKTDSAEQSEKPTICPACGKENQPKNNFCDGCGAQLFKLCPKCGARQEVDDAFCGNCGCKL